MCRRTPLPPAKAAVAQSPPATSPNSVAIMTRFIESALKVLGESAFSSRE
jgi:hypothetical protein